MVAATIHLRSREKPTNSTARSIRAIQVNARQVDQKTCAITTTAQQAVNVWRRAVEKMVNAVQARVRTPALFGTRPIV